MFWTILGDFKSATIGGRFDDELKMGCKSEELSYSMLKKERW